MRQFVKSYHIFVSRIWDKAFLYLIYPLILIGVIYLFAKLGITPAIYLVLVASIIVMVELFYDFLVFAGIASKDTNKLEYLKTSTRGMKILRYSVVADGVRRAYSVSVVLLSSYFMRADSLSITNLIWCTLAILFFIEVGLMVVRSVSMQGIAILLNAVMGMVVSPAIIELCRWEASVWMTCLLVALYLGSFVLGRVIIMRKARGSYYDDRA